MEMAKLGGSLFFKYFVGFAYREDRYHVERVKGYRFAYFEDELNVLNLSIASFGQNFVTPIQMITAMCAIANGGKLMKPYVVQQTHSDGTLFQTPNRLSKGR